MQFQILFFIGNNMSSFLLINNHCDIVSDIYILICILFHNLCRFVDNTQYFTFEIAITKINATEAHLLEQYMIQVNRVKTLTYMCIYMYTSIVLSQNINVNCFVF